MDWDKERIGKLQTAEIRVLLVNATERNRHDVIDLCIEILSVRKATEKPARVRTKVANPRKELEHQLDDRLVVIQKELEQIYDLSPEKAKELSVGVKNFKAHNQLSSTGRSKTGAHQTKEGRVLLDRYISYRVKDSTCALMCVHIVEDGRGLEFHVMGPSALLKDDYKNFRTLRPYLKDDEDLGSYEGGQIFDNFELAADRYKWLISQVAPLIQG